MFEDPLYYRGCQYVKYLLEQSHYACMSVRTCVREKKGKHGLSGGFSPPRGRELSHVYLKVALPLTLTTREKGEGNDDMA